MDTTGNDKTPQDCVGEEQGFIRLTVDEVRDNLIETIRRVMVEGERIVLQQDGSDVAAIIPIREFDRLEYLKHELKPSQYEPYEEEYYEDERGIHCTYPDEVEAEFADILEAVMVDGELFGLLPTPNLGGKEVDIFVPVAILMSIENFWVPEYLIAAKQGESEMQ